MHGSGNRNMCLFLNKFVLNNGCAYVTGSSGEHGYPWKYQIKKQCGNSQICIGQFSEL
jgi:hypothetical protein